MKAGYRAIALLITEAFSKRGVTTAVLKPSMQLTKVVIDDSSVSLHSFMRHFGHGSYRQNFVGEFLIMLLSTSLET